ncbi:hypothetical protein LPJ61_000362 [Coemansia biformis]|uniref:SH3 domain-containing protein n=1 Tax=Coemansia biformis TaxID=1286918 RepID=A0A9W7YIY7_9FUNG|nr:hypothetical protein LPJ61_000362 [Coemansia biformis]
MAVPGGDLELLDAYTGGLLGHFGLHIPLSPRLSDSRTGGDGAATSETLAALEPLPNGAAANGDGDVKDSPHCFPLHQSRYCGGQLHDYSMSTLATVGGRSVASAAEFDAAMDAYFGSPDEHSYINRFFGCQSWAGQPAPRYRVSYTCRSILESQEAQDCNRGRPPPPPLCVSTCNTYVQEWSALTSNHSVCINNALAEDRRFLVSDVGSATGVQAEVARLCVFCKGASSGCCLRTIVQLRCGDGGAKGMVLRGVAVGLALVLSAACLVAVWRFYRWAHVRHRKRQTLACSATSSPGSDVLFDSAGSAGGSAAHSPGTGDSHPSELKRGSNTTAHAGSPLSNTSAHGGDDAEEADIFEVLYPYTSTEGDELSIAPGERVRLLRVFSDGWAFVQRLEDGVVGAIPAVCLDTSRSQAAT